MTAPASRPGGFLGGMSFYRELQDSYPDIGDHVVFVTGWCGEEEVQEFLEDVGRPVLFKPVEPAELLGAVDQIFARATR